MHVRTNNKHKHFDDEYQCLPTNGHTRFFENMLSDGNIESHLNIDYFYTKHHSQNIINDQMCFTVPIDNYYSHLGLHRLQHISLNFEQKIIYNVVNTHTNIATDGNSDEHEHEYKHNNNQQQHSIDYYQPNFIANYPSLQCNYTRIVEHNFFLNQMCSPHSMLFYEHPVDCIATTITTTNDDIFIDDIDANNNKNNVAEPFYPTPNEQNYKRYETHKQYSNSDKDNANFKFVGRLANYKYFNMDEAMLNALELFDKNTTNFNLE